MRINHLIKEKFGVGIFRQNLFRPSFRFMKKYFENKALIGVEIGVYKGANSLHILKNMNIKLLYLIDPWKNYGEYYEYTNEDLDKIYYKTKARLKKYRRLIQLIRLPSSKAVKRFNKKSLDFVYID